MYITFPRNHLHTCLGYHIYDRLSSELYFYGDGADMCNVPFSTSVVAVVRDVTNRCVAPGHLSNDDVAEAWINACRLWYAEHPWQPWESISHFENWESEMTAEIKRGFAITEPFAPSSDYDEYSAEVDLLALPWLLAGQLATEAPGILAQREAIKGSSILLDFNASYDDIVEFINRQTGGYYTVSAMKENSYIYRRIWKAAAYWYARHYGLYTPELGQRLYVHTATAK